ncbi:MAG: helix-turn-helix transcriptional regulator [Oscillospiraceae bacterium]
MYGRIRDLRQDRDLTQRELASIIGMSQTGYSKYETGENDVPTIILIALARFYETSVDFILGLTDNPKPYSESKRET